MYRNAIDKYNAITKFLNDCGIEANMYPQGSFAFGTVVRPSAKDPSANYDLDFICQVGGCRTDYTPSGLRQKIEDALSSSGVYGGKLTVYKECFTIEYADINDIGFSIDIVPAADEDSDNKNRLIGKSLNPELIETAIAIPKHNGERNYSWLTNNPKGFRTWFDKKNAPFFQILKYHRDVYYAKFKDGDELKPISAIINVVTTQIASQHDPNCSVFELLEYVLGELNIYAQQEKLTFKEFEQIYGNRTVFSRPDGKWYIANPANPEDNLSDKWNQDTRIPTYFFRWVNAVKTDLIESLQQEDEQQFRAAIENGFGNTSVTAVLGKKYCKLIPPKPIVSQGVAKPYRSL